MLRLFFLLFLITSILAQRPVVKTEHACEWKVLNLSCQPGEVIHVLWANYGRKSWNLCKYDALEDHSAQCFAPDSTKVVRQRCDNKQKCSIDGTKTFLAISGDPCVGTEKYLEVKYTCKATQQAPQSLEHTVHACEWKILNMKCGPGKSIEIIWANYGRTSWDVCEYDAQGDHSAQCYAPSGTQVVKERCNGKQECSIDGTTTFLGISGDPCVGTEKYLQVTYTCQVKQAPESMEHTVHACEWKTLNIKCNRGKTIEILWANYGRRSWDICEYDAPDDHSCECYAHSSTKIVQNRCDGKRECSIAATNYVFFDPCMGTQKYLEVKYRCN